MKVTAISVQARNQDRVNVSIDGQYRFSLDIAQVVDLGLKQGQVLTDDELALYLRESEFGKLYARALEYCLMRPRSRREVADYLYRKTRTTRYKTKKGDIKEREGVSRTVADRVLERLEAKGHVNDEVFARWWVENRNQRKGASLRKLQSELAAKDVDRQVVEQALGDSERSDAEEIQKIIAKKRRRYDDDKLISYLARQGFRYDDIKTALNESDD